MWKRNINNTHAAAEHENAADYPIHDDDDDHNENEVEHFIEGN